MSWRTFSHWRSSCRASVEGLSSNRAGSKWLSDGASSCWRTSDRGRSFGSSSRRRFSNRRVSCSLCSRRGSVSQGRASSDSSGGACTHSSLWSSDCLKLHSIREFRVVQKFILVCISSSDDCIKFIISHELGIQFTELSNFITVDFIDWYIFVQKLEGSRRSEVMSQVQLSLQVFHSSLVLDLSLQESSKVEFNWCS